MSYRMHAALGPWTRPGLELEDMETMSELLGDPNPIHFDFGAAEAAGLPAPVNPGPANVAYVASMLERAFPEGRLSRLQLRLVRPILAGDSVTAAGRIVDMGSRASPDREYRCEVWLDVDGAERAVEGTATVRTSRTADGRR